MKKGIMILAAVILMTLIGCDKMEGPYITDPQWGISTVEFPELQPEDLYRRILVEEYTGHRCANCPNGHEKLEELHQLFGDTLVIVGIHAGSLARTNDDYPYDFTTENGNTLFSDFGLNAIPRAFFNRTAKDIAVSEWISTVNSMDISRSYAAIQLINEYNANKLTVNIKATMLSEYGNPLQLAVYLIEDGIIKPQLNGSTHIEEYEHKHVLRGSLNGTYGDPFPETGLMEKDSAYTRAYSISFEGRDWNAANCSAVAILLDPDTQEVIQTRVAKIVE
ncbi:MAG: Omp28 family outer membrane lipoprotein [Bacteroidales bacterium]|nr:Omp28 family outer membrane lipoprotein [Bacteroidales bacterium]